MNGLLTKIMDKTIFRKTKIIEACKGKNVLHLGFVNHAHLYKQRIEDGNWLHSQIADVASSVVGIDLIPEVKEIRDSLGYEAYVGDVMHMQKLDIDKTFDVIVCGELIEHVENPGLMLEGIKRFMHSQSLLIITTPNPWSRYRIALIQRGSLEKEWLNPEHVAWYSFQTLKHILERTGYKIVLSDYSYGERKQDFLQVAKSIVGQITLLKRIAVLLMTLRYKYDGLFFIAALDVEE